jgi:hypothetical protein
MPTIRWYESQSMRKQPSKSAPLRVAARGRLPTQAADHDFEPLAKVTPMGIFLPAYDELFIGSFGFLVIEHFGMYTETVSPPLSGSTDGNSLNAAP